MKIITCKFLPKNCAFSVFNRIWVKDPSWIDKYVVNHEVFHAAQQREMLWIPFYIIYIIEFLAKSVYYKSFSKGYLNISHEKEAYRNDYNLNYLKHRKHFAQFRKQEIFHD